MPSNTNTLTLLEAKHIRADLHNLSCDLMAGNLNECVPLIKKRGGEILEIVKLTRGYETPG